MLGCGQSYEEKSPGTVYGGFFLNERHHGLGTIKTDDGYSKIFEVKDRKLFGKNTEYRENGRIFNNLDCRTKEISSTPEAAFYKDLKAITALSADLKSYKLAGSFDFLNWELGAQDEQDDQEEQVE